MSKGYEKLIGFNGEKSEILDGILKVNQDMHMKIFTTTPKQNITGGMLVV